MTTILRIAQRMGIAACLLCATSAFAQGSDRTGKWDIFFETLWVDSQTVDSDNGSKAEIDGDLGWGFGFGYNFNEHWGLDFTFNWLEADYNATVTRDGGGASQNISGTMESSTFGMNAIYYFMPKAFTPYVTGGIGGTWIDTNIPDGLAVPVCWWDPWWGYYCAPTYPTKSDTYFSYNVGAGVRWDSPGSLFLRGQVIQQWIDVGGGVGTHDSLQFRFDIGTRF